jgi:hypothetical protein
MNVNLAGLFCWGRHREVQWLLGKATSVMLASAVHYYLGAFGWTARSRKVNSCKGATAPRA